MRDGQSGFWVVCFSFFLFFIFFYFIWWLKDRVRVQKVMYCQWDEVDYKGQWTQKKEAATKDVGCFFFFFFSPLKSLGGRGKVPLSKQKRNEDICSFWVSKKAQLIVVHSPLQEIKFGSDLKNFPSLTFQIECNLERGGLHCAIAHNFYENPTGFEMKWKPFKEIVCFTICR